MRKPTIAIIGAGSLASFLAPALRGAGYRIDEVISRNTAASIHRAKRLARRVGAKAARVESARLQAQVLWLCVPDREVSRVAGELASVHPGNAQFAFHSSGALSSRELEPLRRAGVAVASIHPLMTFVPGPRPSMKGVPFAVEGDRAAVRIARRIARDLGGKSFLLDAKRKAAYHAWATMTSPLFLAFLVTLEEAALVAGLRPADSRRLSLPIIRQTLENYRTLGPAHSFSGPLVRGDVDTVAKHVAVLRGSPAARDAYLALARTAMERLPVKNKKQMERLLGVLR